METNGLRCMLGRKKKGEGRKEDRMEGGRKERHGKTRQKMFLIFLFLCNQKQCIRGKREI